MLLHTRLKGVLNEEQVEKFEEWLETRPEMGRRGGGHGHGHGQGRGQRR